jgi:mannose-6-phosphate isomerase-like protein (cupin superfamily)
MALTRIPNDVLKLDEQAQATQLAGLPQPFVELFQRGDVSVELFAPRGHDSQTPHDRDEIYIVSSGTGLFRRGEEAVEIRAGDFLFVPAGVAHRFERFSSDFRTWVIFFGPRQRS